MISQSQIESLVRKRNYALPDDMVKMLSILLMDDINNKNYNFSSYKREVFTQQKKKRVIYCYKKLSCEDILCQYLKKQLDSICKIKYSSRNKIINILFNILPTVKDMNDFVIIRADFKSFFDSVLTQHVYNKYICNSMMKRSDKELLEQYVNTFKYCYAGLCLSNGMTEIICQDFDEHIKATLFNYGLFFYERYVDDILLITNKYISKKSFLELMKITINDVFGNSPVELSMKQGKFSFISKRDLITNKTESFSFLGYEFELKETIDKIINFRYGITEKKQRKYKGIIEKAIAQYSKDNNLELLRQRIKIYSSRVVVGRTIGSSNYDWLTKGVVANYNELQYHVDALIPSTDVFMKSVFFNLLKNHGKPVPYFLKNSMAEESIYNIFSNMKRNRSIIFQEKIGVSKGTLIKWIKKLKPDYSENGKDYYRIVADYLNVIKIGEHHS